MTAAGLAAAGLTGCASPLADAATVLRGVAAVTVVHTDGSSVAGVDGLRLRPGDVVRTGPGGRAELQTRDRAVYLASQASLQVVDGAREVLRHGAVVVNAQHGPGLDLQVSGLSVATPEGGAVRAERSVVVRVGALAGSVDVTSATGRHLTVPALHQAIVGGDALPDSTTPLRLTDDDGEARTVPDLVRDDRTLIGLADGIDATGPATARVVTAALDTRPLPAPRGVHRSERLLPAVIAAAGPAAGTTQRYRHAVGYRAAGGSWAVVARLVGTRADGVVATFADFERSQPAGRVGSVRAVLAAAFTPSHHAGRAVVPADNNPTDSPTGSPPSGGGDGGTPQPSSTPTPAPSPSGPLHTVGDTVGTVLGLVPTPPPHSPPTGIVPSLPVPEVTLPGLPPVP